MSEERCQSERIMELEETVAVLQMSNAELSERLTQVLSEGDEARSQMSQMVPATTTTAVPGGTWIAISPAGTTLSTSGSVGISQNDGGCMKRCQQQRVTLQDSINLLNMLNANLLEEMTQLQRTVDQQSADNAKLTAAKIRLTTANAKLTTANAKLTATNAKLTTYIYKLRPHGDLKVSNLKLKDINVQLAFPVSSPEKSGTKLGRRVGEGQRSIVDQSDLLTAAPITPLTTTSISTATTTVAPSTPSNTIHPFLTPTTTHSTISHKKMISPFSSSSTVTDAETTLSSPKTSRSFLPLLSAPVISAERREALSVELHDAALKGSAQKIRQLVSEGADLEYKDVFGNTALHLAVCNGRVEAVDTLVNLDTSHQGRCSYASDLYIPWTQHEECVKELLRAGSNVNATNMDGSTPLHIATCQGLRPIVEMLIVAGADRGLKDNCGKMPKDLVKNPYIIAIVVD